MLVCCWSQRLISYSLAQKETHTRLNHSSQEGLPPNFPVKQLLLQPKVFTLSGGSLGSWVDEERS